MIVHHFLEKLPQSVLPILIAFPDVEFIEILRYIARALEINPEGKEVLQLVDDVKEALSKTGHDSRQVVLIIDEAHLLSLNSLENIRLISNIELTQNKLLQILLIGQIELGVKLRKAEMHQLRQRINVNRVLSPMSPSETIEYVDHRLKIAESSFDWCFDQGCKKLLYEMTGGVPRSINQLCDTALLVCMTEKSRRITKRILKKAYAALNTDLIQAPGDRRIGALSYAFSYVKKFKTAFAAAALILVLTLGLRGLNYNLDEHLKEWLHGADKQEVSTHTAKVQLPLSKAKSQEIPPPRAQEDSPSISLKGPEDQPALTSKPESREAIPGGAPTVKNTDENVPAEGTVSRPSGEAASRLQATAATEDRTTDKNPVPPQPPVPDKNLAIPQPPVPDKNPVPPQPPVSGKSGLRDTVPQGPDQNPYMTQPAGEGANRPAAVERETEDAVPQGPQVRERLPESSDFFMVSVQKGETLTKIAAQWFPEDPRSGRRLILAANPSIYNQNLILAGQILRVPRKRAGELPPRMR
jgi:general secretion pathway protein A